MSKFTLGRQIQQLRAANQGDIALIDQGTLTIGVAATVSVPATFTQPLSLTATPTDPVDLGTLVDGGTLPALGVVVGTEILQQANGAVSLTATPTDPPDTGTLVDAGTITITVNISTNVT